MSFAVIYRWRIPAGKEQAFKTEWHNGTKAILEKYGSLGSRLHKTDEENVYIAYAVWPNRAMWEQMMRDSNDIPTPNNVLIGEPVCLEVVDDLLVSLNPK